MTTLKCKKCGKPLDTASGTLIVVCAHCGTKHRLSEADLSEREDLRERRDRDRILAQAKDREQIATVSCLEEAIALYRTIPGWKDADERAAACQNLLGELTARAEEERLEQERAAEAIYQKAKRKKKVIWGVSLSAGTVALVVTLLFAVILPGIKYGKGNAMMKAGNYYEAILIFGTLDGFMDSEDRMIDAMIANGEFKLAVQAGNLTELVIPDGVTSIEDEALSYCSSLTRVILPDSVTSIGNRAFFNCEALTSIIIPDSVTSIGSAAFRGCFGLTEITISNSVTSIEEYTFSDCSSLTKIVIPNGVTKIGAYAFSDCSSLTKIVIPNGVTKIGEYAFSNCSGLTEITIPKGVTRIEEWTFSNCDSLTSITISKSVIIIEDRAFAYCENLRTIHFTGTRKRWNTMNKAMNNYSEWNLGTPTYTVHCSDGSLTK